MSPCCRGVWSFEEGYFNSLPYSPFAVGPPGAELNEVEAYAETPELKTVADYGVAKDGGGPKSLVERGSAARVVGCQVLGGCAYGSSRNKAYPGEDGPTRLLDYSPVPEEP